MDFVQSRWEDFGYPSPPPACESDSATPFFNWRDNPYYTHDLLYIVILQETSGLSSPICTKYTNFNVTIFKKPRPRPDAVMGIGSRPFQDAHPVTHPNSEIRRSASDLLDTLALQCRPACGPISSLVARAPRTPLSSSYVMQQSDRAAVRSQTSVVLTSITVNCPPRRRY